jgi:hypothetical protein
VGIENKGEIKQVIIDYLTPLGFPNMEADLVMVHLQDIYRHLESKGLLPDGVSFAVFQQAAHHALLYSQLEASFA